MEPTHFESLYPDTTRFNEIEKLLSFIKTGGSSQIVSLPGAGRSTFFGLLSYNRGVRIKHLGDNQKWFHFVMVDFSQVRKKPLFDATKLIFLSLVDSLADRNMQNEYEKASNFFKEGLLLQDELVLFGNLQKTIELLAIEKELTIVFLFDRFHEYIPMLTEDFFRNLRSLRSKAKYRFSIVLSLNRPLQDSLEEQIFSDFYEFLENHTIYLPILDEPGLRFQISYIEKVKGKKLPEKIKNEIINLTNGHSTLTRLCIENILASSNQQLASSFELINFFLEQKTIQKALENIWKALTPLEQNHILRVILGNPVKRGNSRIDPGQARITQVFEENQYLENVGLVKNNKITIPLFAEFIKNYSSSKVEKKVIIYNPQTNEITKGDVAISHGLSGLEFRLLKFCLENPQRILEREEIISVVWTDAKATAGVTDQALDQLIFRLRKKIENDPNNPAHLQTIKGRGFRFNP